MNNNTLQVKFKQRLNKIDSQDYDNIQSWEISEAFNKSQIEWCRRQLAGTNMRKEGDEMSKRRIDDLSLLLKTVKLEGVDIQYDSTFGYFNATNFASIYDPEIGGDYLEFKKIECGAQQCFPSNGGISITQNTETIDMTANTAGYWIPDLTLQYEELFNLRVFTFTTQGNNSTDISLLTNNTLQNWGIYGAVQNTTPTIQPTAITTQQPWVHNINEPGLWYSDGDGNNVFNTNIIMPFTDTSGVYSACAYCNKTAADILADTTMLTTMCTQAPAGYLVGGPHNEYIDCSEVPATFHAIPNLSVLGSINLIQYNYNNTTNSWINTAPNIFGDGNGELCPIDGCWFAPTSVEIQTMSLNNFQTDAFESTPVQDTAPDAWGNVDYTLDGTLDATTNSVGTYVEPTNTEYQIDVTRPGLTIDKCYCAPGTNPINFCTVPRTMTVYQTEVANTDVLLRDNLKNPNFEWCETFCTLQNNEIRIWRKNFYIMDPTLTYYRTPRRIEILGSVDPYTGLEVIIDIFPEFKDDIVEVIIDNAVSLLAGDISDSNQMMRGEQAAEKNN
tara:strand:+ start:909 stop:2579 length:1671 start_codon:yes stop_codon:yes gene_type:complete